MNTLTRIFFLAAGLVLIASIAALGSIGSDASPPMALARVLALFLQAGLPAGAYLFAGIGWGVCFTRLTRGVDDPAPLNAALGVGTLLWLSHALGAGGLLAGNLGRGLAFALVIIGLGLLAWSARRGLALRVSATGVLGAIALGVLLVAASNPPGWLWESEFRGYDALSYHLPLAQEWLLAGRIQGLEHNVYSALPSAVESAFVHLGVLTFAPTDPGSTLPGGLIAGDGWRLIACQWLHAWLGVFAAWVCSRVARGFVPESGRGLAASITFGLVLGTPWMIVTGSLAYNEAPLVAFCAVGVVASFLPGLSPGRRGAVVGLLVGCACIVKPTAILFAGVPAAMGLAITIPARHWCRAAMLGSIAGLMVLAPWLARNAVFNANPVFPALTGVFGTGHWSPEQVARYQAKHAFDGSLLDRLSLLVRPDPHDPAGPRHRGLLHPQWGLFFGLALASVAGLALFRGTRRLGLILLGTLILQVVLWLTFTHLQARFLMPALGIGAIAGGVAIAHLRSPRRAWILGMLCVGAQVLASVLTFARQYDAHPNTLLIVGPALRTGQLLREALRERPDPTTVDRLFEAASPEALTHVAANRQGRLALIGGATPLYFWPVPLYSTTYDRGVLDEAMHAAPDAPEAWNAHLRSRGVGTALVDMGEIGRLSRWGTSDPLLTPERVRAWLETTRPIRAWEDAGLVLVRIPRQYE
ncbi:MAG: hypothetical protein IPM33_03115 [Phycisphaerales bacterium]|nr:hypothetical protein [Phycisphaerales bacterium]